MTKHLASLIRVVLVALFASGVSLLPVQAKAADPVTIAVGQDFKPFEFVDEQGQPAGLIVDYWKLWSKKANIPIKFQPAPWSKTLEMMRSGQADAHAGLNKTDERAEFLDYGDALLGTNSYVFSPVGMQLSGSIDQLSGFRVGVLKGSLEESILSKQVPGAEVVSFEGIDELYDAIAAKKIRLFADVEQTGLYFLSQRNLVPNFRFDAATPLDANHLFAAVAKGKANLLIKVNEGMRLITPQERTQIVRRWLKPKEPKKADTLVIAISRNYPPFTLIDANGQPAGMLVDIWRLWAKKTGKKIEFRQSSWADTLNNLGSGDADAHSGLFRSKERSRWIDFSRPVYEITSSYFQRTGEKPLIDLSGKKVGGVSGSFQESFIRKNHPAAVIAPFQDNEDLIRALANGKIDTFLTEDRPVEDLLRRLGMRGRITRTGNPVLRNEMFFGVRKGEDVLKALIGRGLDAITNEELAEIERRWIDLPDNRFFAKNPLALTSQERAWLAANPVLRVHNEMDWPPFNFNVDGRPQGFSIDYMNLLASKIGVKAEYVSGPSWNDFLGMMKSGDLDVMLNIVKTPERQKYMLYTRPYIDNPNTIISRKDQPYDSLQELFGKTISVPKGFFYEEILKRDFPEIKLHLVKNTLETMKAVSFGKADAALGELAVFNYLMDKHFMTDLVLSGEVKMGSPEYALLNITAHKEQQLLASILNKGVKSIGEIEVRELRQKWFGGTKTERKRQPVLDLTEAEREWLNRHKEIRIGVDPDYPPFEFTSKDGSYAGISSDYMKIVGERLGVEIKRVPNLTWSQVLSGAKAKTVDVLPAVTKTPERDIYLNFTRPHLNHPSAILTRDDFPFITGLTDLRDQSVAMVKGYSTTAQLKTKYPTFKPQEYETPLQALEAVATGKATATVLNLAVATYLIRQNKLNNLKVAANAEINFPGLSIGVRKDWPELVSILNKVLQSVTPGEESEINDRWVSVRYDVAADTEALVRVGLQVAGGATIIVIIIIGFIAYRNRRLEQEMKEREAAAQAKSDFVAVVSHEVRTPMNGVLGMARLILDTELSEEQKDFAHTIVDSGEALLIILNDLLDISKLEAGKLEIEAVPFNLRILVEETINVMDTRAREKGLHLSYTFDSEVPKILLGDGNRLRQILFNFLSNAIKFTNEGGITVSFFSKQLYGNNCQLSMAVTDTGIGIAEETANKLFAPYVQAASGARKYGGTGLGLSICRQLADLMGGVIELDSNPGKGSTFTLKAPFEITSAEPKMIGLDPLFPLLADSRTHEVEQHDVGHLNILLVEDNLVNRKVAVGMVQNLGHQVTVAENGLEALEYLDSGGPFDAILMDRHMPVMDGIEATQKIRAMDGPIADIPIIALTAAVTDYEVETCLESGMNDMVTKPVDPRDLKAALARNVGPAASDGSIPKPVIRKSPILDGDEPPVLDPGVLDRLRTDYGDEMFNELSDDFRRIGESSVTEFHKAAEGDDPDPMMRYAHDLKGSAATMGLMKLSRLCQGIELACKEERLDDARRLGADLSPALAEAMGALSSERDTAAE